MALATYRTKAGAQRYANEIIARFKATMAEKGKTFDAYPVPNNAFGYWVAVEVDGRKAIADKRPRNYGRL